MKMGLTVVLTSLLMSGLATSVQAKRPTIVAATPVVVLMPFLTDNPDFFCLNPRAKTIGNENRTSE
ncbi:MAG: hypothetical protein M1572_03945 [Gammaproteobacteria bacterium]|nr:hypothetical protein [Gammaproteobacteria bacterium]UCG19190.1 MAG: hypothetical protein JSU84_02955 [Thiotrichales bacterium]